MQMHIAYTNATFFKFAVETESVSSPGRPISVSSTPSGSEYSLPSLISGQVGITRGARSTRRATTHVSVSREARSTRGRGATADPTIGRGARAARGSRGTTAGRGGRVRYFVTVFGISDFVFQDPVQGISLKLGRMVGFTHTQGRTRLSLATH